MKRIMLILVLFSLISGASQAADDQIIRIYERITNLQERVHKLESQKLDNDEIAEIKDAINEIQQMKESSDGSGNEYLAAKVSYLEERIDEVSEIKVASSTKELSINLNIVWILLGAFLVMFMQVGFALVEAGLTRAKNTVHTLTMNLMDYGLGSIAFWATGFAFMFGSVGAIDSLGIGGDVLNSGITLGGEDGFTILGLKGFFLSGLAEHPITSFFFFQMVFAATANTICTGTLAERWRIESFTVSSIAVAGIIYPIFGCWVWGGGWLQQLGYLDFAGSTVVHAAGGIIAIVGAKHIGPRFGKFNSDGTSNPIPGHNLPYVFLGTFILAFSWFGFNTASSLAAGKDLGLIATNTALASAAGSIVAMLITKYKFGKPDPTFCCNGLLAGLVGITASCAYVDTWAAVVIGAISGLLVVFSALFIEDKLKIDDPVGAISVHGTCGLWGGLAVGIFALPSRTNGGGLLYGGTSLFLVQVIGVVVCAITFTILASILFKVLLKITPTRASNEEQDAGLDITEMGVIAYNNDVDV